MTAVHDAAITVVNTYRLLSGPEEFVAAVTNLARRVEAEGHPGVLDYRFYCAEGSGNGRAVVRYRDPEAWVGHHELVMAWPEMAALRIAAELTEVALFGPISPRMRDWFDRMGLATKLRHQGEPLAGFLR